MTDLWRLDQARIDPPEPVEYDEPDSDDLRDEAFYREREELVPENDGKAA